MSLRKYKKHVLSLFCMTVATFPAIAQTDPLFLTIDQLFERGVRHSLQIQADVLKESIAQERTQIDFENLSQEDTQYLRAGMMVETEALRK